MLSGRTTAYCAGDDSETGVVRRRGGSEGDKREYDGGPDEKVIDPTRHLFLSHGKSSSCTKVHICFAFIAFLSLYFLFLYLGRVTVDCLFGVIACVYSAIAFAMVVVMDSMRPLRLLSLALAFFHRMNSNCLQCLPFFILRVSCQAAVVSRTLSLSSDRHWTRVLFISFVASSFQVALHTMCQHCFCGTP